MRYSTVIGKFVYYFVAQLRKTTEPIALKFCRDGSKMSKTDMGLFLF